MGDIEAQYGSIAELVIRRYALGGCGKFALAALAGRDSKEPVNIGLGGLPAVGSESRLSARASTLPPAPTPGPSPEEDMAAAATGEKSKPPCVEAGLPIRLGLASPAAPPERKLIPEFRFRSVWRPA